MLARAVVERLARGGALVGLGLEMTEAGRFDLRGLTLPVARVQRRGEAAGFSFEERTGQVKLNGTTLHGLDLFDEVLDDLWLTESHVSDCVFDGARWRDGHLP